MTKEELKFINAFENGVVFCLDQKDVLNNKIAPQSFKKDTKGYLLKLCKDDLLSYEPDIDLDELTFFFIQPMILFHRQLSFERISYITEKLNVEPIGIWHCTNFMEDYL